MIQEKSIYLGDFFETRVRLGFLRAEEVCVYTINVLEPNKWALVIKLVSPIRPRWAVTRN